MKMILRKNDGKGSNELYEITAEEYRHLQEKLLEIMVNENTDPLLAISVLEVTSSQMKKFYGIDKVRIDWVK
jgi:hypothetical protein